MALDLVIAPCPPSHAETTVRLWRASFEHGVGVASPHDFANQLDYFRRHLLAETTVRIAHCPDRVLGFIAFTPDSVMQLYVDPAHLGQGIGTRLLDLAKASSSGELSLYAFARNTRARVFYERHGFEAVAFGVEPMLQLEDVRYVWHRGAAAPAALSRTIAP